MLYFFLVFVHLPLILFHSYNIFYPLDYPCRLHEIVFCCLHALAQRRHSKGERWKYKHAASNLECRIKKRLSESGRDGKRNWSRKVWETSRQTEFLMSKCFYIFRLYHSCNALTPPAPWPSFTLSVTPFLLPLSQHIGFPLSLPSGDSFICLFLLLFVFFSQDILATFSAVVSSS